MKVILLQESKKPKDQKRTRYLSAEELKKLSDALDYAELSRDTWTNIAAIKLLIFTGCRKSEILNLRWREVDFERNCFRLEDSKTGAKVVQVGDIVMKYLKTLPSYQKNEHVLPSHRRKGPINTVQKFWGRLKSKAQLEDLRIHDLRHSFASIGVMNGDSLYIVGKLLGHKNATTTQQYAHLADDPVRSAADNISSKIAEIVKTGT